MKKFIPILSIAVAMAACTTNPDSITKSSSGTAIEAQAPAINPDTIGLSDYHLWKAQNELAEEREISNPSNYSAVAPAKKKVNRTPVQKVQYVEYDYPKSTSTGRTSTKRQESDSNEGTGTTGDGNGNDGIAQGSGTVEAEEEKKKEGMSKAAKGAIIGGAGGAATGAVINKKNRVAGAVIGAVIGAGGGYVVGRKMDKKDGRN